MQEIEVMSLALAHRDPASPVSQMSTLELQYLIREYVAVAMPTTYTSPMSDAHLVVIRDARGAVRKVRLDPRAYVGHRFGRWLVDGCMITRSFESPQSGLYTISFSDVATGSLIRSLEIESPINQRELFNTIDMKADTMWCMRLEYTGRLSVGVMDLHTGKTTPSYTLATTDWSFVPIIHQITPQSPAFVYSDHHPGHRTLLDLKNGRVHVWRDTYHPENEPFYMYTPAEDGSVIIRINAHKKCQEWIAIDCDDPSTTRPFGANKAIVPFGRLFCIGRNLYDVHHDRVVVYDVPTGRLVRDLRTESMGDPEDMEALDISFYEQNHQTI